MGWRRSILEGVVWGAARCAPVAAAVPSHPHSIFVLRNNDIGDLLVVTPLFDALRRRFPDAEIVAGVGQWNAELLHGNPHLNGIMVVNAPWHNRITGTRDPGVALRYVAASPEVQAVRRRHFDIGIDVLGSAFGSLLLMRAGIPWRLGVDGYAGGQTGVQQSIQYDAAERVGRSALRFAELLGARDLPGSRPQVFLSKAESDEAERLWLARTTPGQRRIVIAPGGGHPGRVWPVDHFVELARHLTRDRRYSLAVIGGPADAPAAGRIAAAAGVLDLAGRSTLRQSMAVIARADLVLCNSSFAMHAAAASGVHAIVLLGEAFESARAHAAQWGHGDLTTVLGRDRQRPNILAPAEVIEVVTKTRDLARLNA
jgi:ADP-heptose:LPS heptosyltransferase